MRVVDTTPSTACVIKEIISSRLGPSDPLVCAIRESHVPANSGGQRDSFLSVSFLIIHVHGRVNIIL